MSSGKSSQQGRSEEEEVAALLQGLAEVPVEGKQDSTGNGGKRTRRSSRQKKSQFYRDFETDFNDDWEMGEEDELSQPKTKNRKIQQQQQQQQISRGYFPKESLPEHSQATMRDPASDMHQALRLQEMLNSAARGYGNRAMAPLQMPGLKSNRVGIARFIESRILGQNQSSSGMFGQPTNVAPPHSMMNVNAFALPQRSQGFSTQSWNDYSLAQGPKDMNEMLRAMLSQDGRFSNGNGILGQRPNNSPYPPSTGREMPNMQQVDASKLLESVLGNLQRPEQPAAQASSAAYQQVLMSFGENSEVSKPSLNPNSINHLSEILSQLSQGQHSNGSADRDHMMTRGNHVEGSSSGSSISKIHSLLQTLRSHNQHNN